MIKGIGVDIVEIDRLRDVMQRRSRFISRLFTPGEQEYCLSKQQPHRHFAARFAAKEAVAKSFGSGKRGMKWTDIEVCRDDQGMPYIKLRGGAAAIASHRGICDVAISLSFTRNNAVASAVAMSAG